MIFLEVTASAKRTLTMRLHEYKFGSDILLERDCMNRTRRHDFA